MTSISARDIVTWGRRCLTEMSELLTKTKQLDNQISEQQSQIDKITAKVDSCTEQRNQVRLIHALNFTGMAGTFNPITFVTLCHTILDFVLPP